MPGSRALAAGALPWARATLPDVIRARTGRRVPRPSSPIVALLVALALAGCGTTATPPTSPDPVDPAPSGAESGAPSTSSAPAASPTATPGGGDPQPTPSSGGSSPRPSDGAPACSGSDANRTFFTQAAGAMSWAVYCAVLPDGWFLETGTYRLAEGGQLLVTYRGPADVHIAMAQGNVCDGVGADVDVCAPRDAVIGPAVIGDRTGDLGRLANGLVLDVDRGANPSWRITGLGVTEADFLAICAAMLKVDASN